MNDLEQVRSDFIAIKNDADRLVEGMPDARFYDRPAPGRWSVCECLTHLNVANGLDLEPLERAIRDARAKGWTASGPFRYGAISTWFIRHMEPPAKFKSRAPKVYAPPPREPRDAVMRDFHRIHDRLIAMLDQAEGLDLARIKVATPVARWIKFSLTQRLRLIAAHDRRHIWQASQNQ